MLEAYVKERRKERDILLMTHIVLGYPSFEESHNLVKTMVEAGVDLMELQIPFSEPIADGPVILHANQQALAAGATVKQCMDFAGDVARSYPIPFLFMSYYNILFKYGVERFAEEMNRRGLKGAIVPDLPPEEANGYLRAMERFGLDPVFIFSPTTPDTRMGEIAAVGRGFIYCVARKGVTGLDTHFTRQLEEYLARCRRATSLPLALGFGVKNRTDIDFLRGKADIAIIGTQTIRLMDEGGIDAVRAFIEGLR
ncbi:MAG: tryptophan synthase subunit alpha [Deltaproteobacteria bacterium]|nr:tryptophan synthase subunit alpha [Deltaproteobacteria bacterium]